MAQINSQIISKISPDVYYRVAEQVEFPINRNIADLVKIPLESVLGQKI